VSHFFDVANDLRGEQIREEFLVRHFVGFLF
jgi:hypothetical protein